MHLPSETLSASAVWKNYDKYFFAVFFLYNLPVFFCSDLFIPTSELHVNRVPIPDLTGPGRDAIRAVRRTSGCQAWPPWPLSSLAYVPVGTTRRGQASLVKSRSEFDRHTQCLVTSAFGSHLSPPFKLQDVEIIPSRGPERRQLIQHLRVSSQSLVWLSCQPPEDYLQHPDDIRVSFVVNNSVELRVDASPDKYLLVKPPVAMLDIGPGVSTTRQHYSHHLGIRQFAWSDTGVYACVASETGTGRHLWTGSRLHSLQLDDSGSLKPADQLEKAPVSAPHSLSAEETENVSIICPGGTAGVSFGADESRLVVGPRIRWNANFAVLSINHVLPGDEGQYTCLRDAPRGHDSKANVLGVSTLRVHRNRSVHLPVQRISANLGESVLLNCTVSGFQGHPVWFFNGHLRNDFVTASLSEPTASHLISIPNLRPEDTGVYQCVFLDAQGGWSASRTFAVSLAGTRLHSFEDNVSGHQLQSPVSLPPGLVTAHLGDTVMFTCFPSPTATTNPGASSFFSRLSVAHVKWQSVGGRPLDWLGPSIAVNLTLTRACQFGVYTCLSRATVESPGDGSGPRLVWLSRQIRLLPAGRPFFSLDSRTGPCPPNSLPPSRPTGHRAPGHSTGQRAKRQSLSLGRNRLPPPAYNDLSPRPYYPAPASENVGHQPDLLPWGYSQPGVLPPQPLPGEGKLARRQAPDRPKARVGRRLPAPNVSPIGDNLAANISWPPVLAADFYRLQLRSRLATETRWSRPVQLEEPVVECCSQTSPGSCCGLPLRLSYLTNRQPAALEPGRIYQFLVQALRQSHQPPRDDHSSNPPPGRPLAEGQQPLTLLVGQSHWSKPVSFDYISKVAPVITVARRMPDGSILVQWTLASSAVGFPVDHFLLLYRAEERLENGQLVYQGFHPVVVPGGDTMEYKLVGLAHGMGYQIVVYGVKLPRAPGQKPEDSVFTGGANGRRITMFSHEVFVEPTPKSPGSSAGGNAAPAASDSFAYASENQTDSNRLMFIILGALVGAMLLVVTCLVVLCFCRQQREKRRRGVVEHADAARQPTLLARARRRPLPVKSGSVNSRKQLPSSGRFMLDQLSASDHRENPVAGAQDAQSCSLHASLMQYHQRQLQQQHQYQYQHQQSYNLTYPPPGNPAPPPPELMTADHQSEALSMADCLTYQRQAAAMNMIGSSMAMNPIGQPGVMAVAPAYSAGMNHKAARPLPPYEMKREPPSGGSVHEDETDNENACEVLAYLPPTSYRMVYRHPSTLASFPHPATLPPSAGAPNGISPSETEVLGRLYYPQASSGHAGLPLGNCLPLVYAPSQDRLVPGGAWHFQPSPSVWTQANQPFSSGCYDGTPVNQPSNPPGYPPTERFDSHRPQSVTAASGHGCRSASRSSQGHDRGQDRPTLRAVRHSSVPPTIGSHCCSQSEVSYCARMVMLDENGQSSQPMMGDGPVDPTAIGPDGENGGSLTGLPDQPLMSSSPRQANPGVPGLEQHRSDSYSMMPIRHQHVAYHGLPPSGAMEHHRALRSPSISSSNNNNNNNETDQYPHSRIPPNAYWLSHQPTNPMPVDGPGYNPPMVCSAFPTSPPVPAHRSVSIRNPLVYGQCNPVTMNGFQPHGEIHHHHHHHQQQLQLQQQQSLCQGAPRVRDYSEYGIPNIVGAAAAASRGHPLQQQQQHQQQLLHHHHQPQAYANCSYTPRQRYEEQQPSTAILYRQPLSPLPLSTNGQQHHARA